MKFYLKSIFCILIGLIFSIFGINEFNKLQVEPKSNEINVLKRCFGNIEIKSENDIYRISSVVISQIRHKINIQYPIDVENVVEKKRGLCYDRSLILQKIFLYNKISIRPVFIYFKSGSTKVSFFDLFASNLQSHSIFEFKYNGEWYVMRSNYKLIKLIKLDQYISEGKSVPKYSKYIRCLSNRNSKFIYPSFLPDIYWFN